MTGQILLGLAGFAAICAPIAAGALIMRRFQRSVRQAIRDAAVPLPWVPRE